MQVRDRQIGMLELLKLCIKYGVDTCGVSIISALTGLTRNHITKLINEYCIIPNLNSGLLDD
jgi:hypothetical protein